MKKSTYIIYLLACAILLSCGGAGEIKQAKIEKSRAFDASKDKIWDAIISILGDLNFPIKVIDKNSWLIQSDRVTVDEADIYTYTTTEGGEYKGGRFSFTFYISDSQGKSNVNITADFEGDYLSGLGAYQKQYTTKLYSNGKYERQIFDLIKAKL